MLDKKRLEYTVLMDSAKIVNRSPALLIHLEPEDYMFLGLRGTNPQYKVMFQDDGKNTYPLLSYILGHDYSGREMDILVVFRKLDRSEIVLRGKQKYIFYIESN